MTLDEWKSIKTGQTIYSKSGKPRLVIRGCGNSLCIALKPIRKKLNLEKMKLFTIDNAVNSFLSPPKKEQL